MRNGAYWYVARKALVGSYFVMKGRCNYAILPKIATLVGGTVLGSLVYTSTALAAFPPLIMEVQPVPADNPTQLVIYGQYFGAGIYGENPIVTPDPKFTFGTYDGHLFIPEDQTLCDTAPPAPLDSGITGYSCVVVDLPLGDELPWDEIVPGDYLIEIEVVSDNLACTSKPSASHSGTSPQFAVGQVCRKILVMVHHPERRASCWTQEAIIMQPGFFPQTRWLIWTR